MKTIKRIRWTLALLLVLYAGVGIGLRTVFKTEVFPVFTWDLFSTVPPTVVQDFELKVLAINGEALDPPRYFSLAPDLFPAATSLVGSDLINRLGRACVEHNLEQQQAIVQHLANGYVPAQTQYQVVQRTYDILVFYRDHTLLQETVVCP